MTPIKTRAIGKERRLGDNRGRPRRQDQRTAAALRPTRFWIVTDDDLPRVRHGEFIRAAFFATARDAATYVIDNPDVVKDLHTCEVIVRHTAKRGK